MFMSPSMLKSGRIVDRITDITESGKATLVKDPKSGKVALVIPKVSDTSYNLDNTFHGYESGVLLYKKNINGAVLEGETSALWNKTEFYTYLNGLKVGIYTESEASDFTLNKGKENKGSEGRESEEKTEKICGGGPETHNYYCSYDGQGNIAQVSNMAGDMPYNLYAYDSYGTQTGSDYSNDSFSSYKGYDKGPFGYKTGVRQYDPETGRFLSPDAFKGYITDPASQHPYMYCHGNPVKFSDPSGYWSSDEENKKKRLVMHLVLGGVTDLVVGVLISLADSPAPGPADVVGVGVAAKGVATIGTACELMGLTKVATATAITMSASSKGGCPDQVQTRINNAVRNFTQKSKTLGDQKKMYSKMLKQTLNKHVDKYKHLPGGNETGQELRVIRGTLKSFREILEKRGVQFGPGGEIIQ